MTKVTRRRSILFWLILLLFVFCLPVIILASPSVVVPLLSLDPASAVGTVGTTVDVDVRLDDVTNVFGAQLDLTFDETIVQVVGAQVTPGTCPEPNFVAENIADNVNGTIDYAVTQLAPTDPCTGGVVATITYECIAEGTSPVSFVDTIISDPNGLQIAHGTQAGQVECQVGGFDIIGSVALQSWPVPYETFVALIEEGSGSVGGGLGGIPVELDGTFRLRAADVTKTYTVFAYSAMYLDATATGITGAVGDEIDLGLVTLRAGDINGDGVINILDLTAVSGNFNKTSPQIWAWGP